MYFDENEISIFSYIFVLFNKKQKRYVCYYNLGNCVNCISIDKLEDCINYIRKDMKSINRINYTKNRENDIDVFYMTTNINKEKKILKYGKFNQFYNLIF